MKRLDIKQLPNCIIEINGKQYSHEFFGAFQDLDPSYEHVIKTDGATVWVEKREVDNGVSA